METHSTPPQPTVGICLKMARLTLECLRTSRSAMALPNPPEIALIELAPDVYTLGGETLEDLATALGSPLLPPEQLDVEVAKDIACDYTSRPLLLGKYSLQALTQPRWVMDGYCPPQFGLTNFGESWRMGGDLIADYLESRGAPVLRGSHLDSNGNDIQCDDHN